MLRFASTPGDMRIDELRIALFNYLIAKQRDEDFIVRIEDIDKKKNIEGKDQEIVDILGLFDIEYTQIIHQSQNLKFHAAMALQLLHEKKAFSCFCSDEWLENKQKEAEAANKIYSYDDACRNLPAELVIDNTAPFTVRIIRPDGPVVVHDKIKDELCFDPDIIDSFVIMNQDKTSTYNFATAVDDMLNDISFVVCSENDIINTPKQIHVRNQLAYEKKIEYAHIPSFEINGDVPTVTELLKEGYLPEAISNYLILTGNKTPQEIFTLQEAQEWFNFETMSKSPISFDREMLQHINREHLKIMDPIELSRYVGFADADIGELARVYLNDVYTTRELKEKIAPIFENRENIPETFRESVTTIKEVIITAPYFDEYDAFKKYLFKETGIADENIEIALRILLTNREDGPDIKDIYKYLKNYIGEIVK